MKRTPSVLVAAAAAGVLGGCETDSFLDPSVTGRWEKTPVVMPILDRLSAIEDEPTEFVQTSSIVPSDLVPEVDQYRFAAGDAMEIRIRDFFLIGQEEAFERQLDMRGYVDLPRLGAIRAQGRTSAELVTVIENAIRDKQINDRAVVSINVRSQRKQTYAVLGAVQTPGTFFIPSPDYRLLDAMGTAGAFNETIPFVYVIRQISLTDAAAGRVPEPESARRSRIGRDPSDVRLPPKEPDAEPKQGEDLLKLIDELSQPKKDEGSPPLPGLSAGSQPAVPVRPGNEPPAIDLPDGSASSQPADTGAGGWAFVNGQWVKSQPGGDPQMEQNLVTQRVIKVPVGPLLAGAADANIVIRPGDVIRVPVPRSGLVYMTGQVQRPGPYNLPTDGKLTLLRAFDTAGGLNGLAIPERVDLTRVVGEGRQATIRLDAKAIAEQTQPDIYLKPDDRINVGTTPPAVTPKMTNGRGCLCLRPLSCGGGFS